MPETLLKKGSTGEEVEQLQQALKALGYDPGAADGRFGSTTGKAVEAFQTDHGLIADGVVGDATWLSIDEADASTPTIKKGATGNAVRRAQKRLSLGGYDTRGVDGIFGATTESAVKRFQMDQGLADDGIIGPSTWQLIDGLGD